jgi:dipeptidase E
MPPGGQERQLMYNAGMSQRILLLSSSNVFGTGYMDHAEAEIRDIMSGAKILFIPYALLDHEAYAAKACERLNRMGLQCDSIHRSPDAKKALEQAEAIFIGGGNTFRLLNTLYQHDLVAAIRDRVDAGASYLGSSAGTNVACPTIRTTNDMPIVTPPSFSAIDLVPFQINPHYIDPDPNSKHMGESREERIREYHEENDLSVVGLREGTMIRVQNGEYILKGHTSARVFRKGFQPVEVEPGATLNFLLETTDEH